MDPDKTYYLIIKLHDTNVEWITDDFTGKDDIENLGGVLTRLGTVESVFFKLISGNKLFMTSAMIDRCIFILKERL